MDQVLEAQQVIDTLNRMALRARQERAWVARKALGQRSLRIQRRLLRDSRRICCPFERVRFVNSHPLVVEAVADYRAADELWAALWAEQMR
jgi:hypothetical protein